jgi:bacterioferritin-associated ferredoxin
VAAAEWAGEMAGLAAARDLGALNSSAFVAASRRTRARLARAERFGQTISRMMALRPGLVAAATAQTIVCRCEDVTCGDIERVAARGARTLNQLKSVSRCGMGPCQGRSCGEAAAEIMARQTGQDRSQVGQWTARTPARPIALDATLGAYEYADIPRPPLLPA